jgi:glycosyltransferase involved in cell wall biosynthesis
MNLSIITTMAGNPWGGSEELWCKLAYDALKGDHQVDCSIFNWGELPQKTEALQKEGAKIKKRSRFIYSEIYKKPWGKLKEYTIAQNQLSRDLNGKDFSLISMGGFCDLAVDAFRIPLLKTKTPFSMIIHVNPENTYLNVKKIPEIIEVCKKAYKVYFVSKRLKEIAIRQTGYSFPNGELIINPVNMEETGILAYPKAETIQMACVGRLNAKVKGQALLLQCLSDKQWKTRNWHLNIYGKGGDLDYLKLLCVNFNIEDKVTFHGHVENIREDIWSKNHILIMPSYYEGMPIALVEAMLCGRTAVVTDVGGNTELIKDNKTGFIASAPNKRSFQEALEKAWLLKSNWEAAGKDAYQDAYNYIYHSEHANDIKDILPF